MIIAGVSWLIGASVADPESLTPSASLLPIGSRVMAELKDPKMTGKDIDRSNVGEHNVILVVFNDLPEEEQEKIERELQQEIKELQRLKVSCYQKTRYGVIKKADTTGVSAMEVKLPIRTPEEVAHFVDVSIPSKYGSDLDRLTRVLGEDMRNTLGSFKQDLDNSLPRQIRLVALEVYGEAQNKRAAAMDSMLGQCMDIAQGVQNAVGAGCYGNRVANPNLQQPYFQTIARGPTIPSITNGVPQPMVEPVVPGSSSCSARLIQTDRAAGGELSDAVRDQVTRTLRELSFTPKGRA